MLLFFATHDGQAEKIAGRLAARLAERGIAVTPRDLATTPDAAAEARAAALVVLVAAVRYGRHLPAADRFLAACGTAARPVPLAFISVNLTARKPGKQDAAGSPYLRKSIARHRLAPLLAAAVAGRLDYPRYSRFDRMMIRFIMLLTGGPTDPSTTVEFTDWAAVDALAAQIAALPGAG